MLLEIIVFVVPKESVCAHHQFARGYVYWKGWLGLARPKSKYLPFNDQASPCRLIPITFICPKFYGRKEINLGMDMQGGKVFFKQGATENPYGGLFLNAKGGTFEQRNTEMGKVVKSYKN